MNKNFTNKYITEYELEQFKKELFNEYMMIYGKDEADSNIYYDRQLQIINKKLNKIFTKLWLLDNAVERIENN